MERKKEDIEGKLKQIQRLLKENASIEDAPPAEVLKPTKRCNEGRPKNDGKQAEQLSIREELSEIKNLLLVQIDGQRRLEESLSEIKRYIAGSAAMKSLHSAAEHHASQLTYHSKTTNRQQDGELSYIEGIPSQRYY